MTTPEPATCANSRLDVRVHASDDFCSRLVSRYNVNERRAATTGIDGEDGTVRPLAHLSRFHEHWRFLSQKWIFTDSG